MSEYLSVKDSDVKDLVAQIIGYDITGEGEREIVEKIFWVEFEHAPAFRIKKNIATQTFELIAEGENEPTHIIPIRVIQAIRHGVEFFVYRCTDCIEELKNRPPNLDGFPHDGTQTEKIDWALNNLDKIKPPMPHSSRIGCSIVLRHRFSDGIIRRDVYCTKPYSTHQYSEEVQSLQGKMKNE